MVFIILHTKYCRTNGHLCQKALVVISSQFVAILAGWLGVGWHQSDNKASSVQLKTEAGTEFGNSKFETASKSKQTNSTVYSTN